MEQVDPEDGLAVWDFTEGSELQPSWSRPSCNRPGGGVGITGGSLAGETPQRSAAERIN